MNTLSPKIDNQAFGFNKTSMSTATSSSSRNGSHVLGALFDSSSSLSGFDFMQTPASNEALMDIANNTLPMTLDNIMPLGSFEFSPIDPGFDVANFSESISKSIDDLNLIDKMVGGNAGTEVWKLLKDVPLGFENIAVTELSNTQGKLGQSLYGETVDLLLTDPKHLDDYVRKYGIEDAVQPDTLKSSLNTGGEYLTNVLVDGIEALVDDHKKVIKDFGNSLVDLAKLGNDYIKSNTLVGVVTSLQQGDIAGIVESYYRVDPVKEVIVNELKSLTKGYGNLGLLPHLASRVVTGAGTGAVAAPVGAGITVATVKAIGKGASHASKALQTVTSQPVLSAVAESVQKALPSVAEKLPNILTLKTAFMVPNDGLYHNVPLNDAPTNRVSISKERVVPQDTAQKFSQVKVLSPYGLASQIKHIDKHLPDTNKSNKLIRTTGSAHVFTDKQTLANVTNEVFERGAYTGTVRGSDRFGLIFNEPIGYRISNDGRKPLYYAEMKVQDGFYHLNPRTRAGR